VNTINLILLLIAAVLFGLAAVNVTHPRINLVALGLLAWVLVPLIALLHPTT
jgi:hypothetical protein